MKIYNTLYEDFNQLRIWIERQDINHENQLLVTIHSDSLSSTESVELARYIKQLLPHTSIIGSTVSGVIYHGEIYTQKTLISLKELEYGTAFSKIQSTLGLTPNDIAQSIQHFSKKVPTHLGIALFDFSQQDLAEITDTLTTIMPNVRFVGGIAGNMYEDGSVESFLFDDNGHYTNAYAVTFFSSEYILGYSDIITGHNPISKHFTITKADGVYIDEIEDTPAAQWIEEQLSLQELAKNSTTNETEANILLHFPLVFDDYNSTTRFLKAEKETNQLKLYHAKVQANQNFRIGYVSHLKSVEELQAFCQYLQMVSAECIFCYSCLFRKLFAKDIVKWELSAFKDSEICGAFMLGEIGTKDNQIQLLNGSSSFFTLAEKAEHIQPNLHIFDSVDAILFEANDALIKQIQIVEKKFQSELFAALIEHEKELKSRFLYVDEMFFESIPQFIKRQIQNTQQQICLISIEDSKKHLLLLGEEIFEKLALENRQNIVHFLKTQYPNHTFHFYRYDSANFFFIIEEKLSDTTFIDVIKNTHTHFVCNTFSDEKAIYFNDFTFTLNGIAIQQLLDFSAVEMLSIEQKRFNHCDATGLYINHLHEEFQIVAALNSIIQENAIIPYFQGIYDNKKNCFHMYEALMRLQHPDGRMLFPNDFMDIAKKYNLYLPLSRCMVTKIFELFKERNEIITINISAYDILSEEFRNTVFKHLDMSSNPQNFVFELLETEAFTDLETLRIFIHHVKQYGCKVAVDDFGSGYSNFIEFGNLDVDYLKINGSLTKLLGTDSNYSHILNSIAFMGEKMRVKLIAEFVETAATQKLLIQSGVHYSQGYFFSKPMPFSELKIISEENIAKSEQETEEQTTIHKEAFNQNQAKQESLFVFLGGGLVALLTILSVIFFVRYNQNEFKKINDTFLIEIATGISDKIALFAEESKISLQLMSVAMSEYAAIFDSVRNYSQELTALNVSTKFNDTYVSYDGKPAVDGEGRSLNIPMNEIYGKTYGTKAIMLPIYTDQHGNKILIFSANLFLHNVKVGEIYGTYMLDDIAKLLALKSFGGEAFYHINQVDGTPIYLSGRTENAFTAGDMYDFIGSLEIINGHTAQSIKEDMFNGKTVLLNYLLKGEERSAVMVRIPNTDWCVVSIVLNEINSQMLKTNNRSTILFISFIAILYILYFMLITIIFKKHKNIILETLEASQSLSNSLQTSIEKDSLTGTYSRATAIEKISSIISVENDKNTVHALAILDIDNFKYINDTYGHHTGDLYLQSFVSAVKSAIKPGSILGRLGGDEFLLLLNDINNKEQVQSRFDKIFANIHSIVLGGADLHTVSVSAGIVMIKGNKKTYEELMIQADNTLYEAKYKGKNTYLFADNNSFRVLGTPQDSEIQGVKD